MNLATCHNQGPAAHSLRKWAYVLVALLLCLRTLSASEGQCTYLALSVTPKSDSISAMPVILIDFSNHDFKLYEKLEGLCFTMIDDQGNEVELIKEALNKGDKNCAQLMLKAYRPLKKGSTVSIIVDGIEEGVEADVVFQKKIESRSWMVAWSTDRSAPHWGSEFGLSYENQLESSASYHGVRVQLTYCDDHKSRYDQFKELNALKGIEGNEKIVEQIIVEVVNDNGQRYYYTTYNNDFWIVDGLCGAAFRLGRNKTYNFEIWLMDMSGNRSKTSQKISFETN